jgi:hypothetical protein
MWDAQKLEFTNSPEATKLVTPHMRAGWEMSL